MRGRLEIHVKYCGDWLMAGHQDDVDIEHFEQALDKITGNLIVAVRAKKENKIKESDFMGERNDKVTRILDITKLVNDFKDEHQ